MYLPGNITALSYQPATRFHYAGHSHLRLVACKREYAHQSQQVRSGSISTELGVRAMSGLPSIATELQTSLEVRFVPTTEMKRLEQVSAQGLIGSLIVEAAAHWLSRRPSRQRAAL